MRLAQKAFITSYTQLLISSGPPSVSNLTCVRLFKNVGGAENVTVRWTLSGADSGDFYLINITTNAPNTPYGGLTSANVTQHELTGFMADYEYNITVRAVNCGNQGGRESDPLTISQQQGMWFVEDQEECMVVHPSM